MINYQQYSTLLINCCMMLGVVIMYHLLTNTSSHQQIVSVNVTALTQDWIASIAEQNLTQEETTTILTKHAVALDLVLQELSQKHRWIILPSTNVLAGAQDMTVIVSNEVNKRL